MEPIKKYEVSENPSEGVSGFHIEPDIECVAWAKNERIFTLNDIAYFCNLAYTQAVIDMLNGDIQLPKAK